MKKKVVLFLCLLFMLQATVLAADSRYEDVKKGDSIIGQFDKETLQYVKDPYSDAKLLSIWIKIPSAPNEVGYNLNHYLFGLQDRKMMLLASTKCNANGETISQMTNNYNPSFWTNISPESTYEACYNSALKYSHENDASLQKEYNKRMNIDNKNKHNMFSIFTEAFDFCSGGLER